jgi:hypothetical protein
MHCNISMQDNHILFFMLIVLLTLLFLCATWLVNIMDLLGWFQWWVVAPAY